MRKFQPYRLHLLKTAILSLGSGIVWAVMMVYQIETVGLSALELVLVGTTMELTILLFEIPTGIVADVYSRRLSVVLGYALVGVSYLVQGVFPVFGVILLGQVIWGIGYTFTSGAYDAWLVDELGQANAGNAFIRASQIERLAGLAGLVLGILLGAIHLQLAILVGGVMIIALSVFLILFMPETNFAPVPKGDRSTVGNMFHIFREGIELVRQRPALRTILLIGLFYGLYSEAWDRLWQLHMIEDIGFPMLIVLPPVVWIGLMNATQSLLTIGFAEWVRRRVDMNHSPAMRHALFVLTVLMVVGMIGYGLSGIFVIGLATFLLFTISRGLVGPIYATWSNQHIESGVRATVLSFQSQLDAFGQIVGGPPLGIIGQASLQLAFFASAGILSPNLWLLRRSPKKKNVPPEEVDADV